MQADRLIRFRPEVEGILYCGWPVSFSKTNGMLIKYGLLLHCRSQMSDNKHNGMKQLDINISTGGIQSLFGDDSSRLANFCNLIGYLVREPCPAGTVMVTLEEHDTASGMCAVAMCASENPGHLGRRERYDRCIYSGFSDVPGRPVTVDNVRRHPGYLALDTGVRSEIFFECDNPGPVRPILNAEFSSIAVSEEAKKWFSRLTMILTGRSDDKAKMETSDDF